MRQDLIALVGGDVSRQAQVGRMRTPRAGSIYSIYLLYWYTSTNTDAAAADADAAAADADCFTGTQVQILTLYWYTSTNTDAAAADADAARSLWQPCSPAV